METKSDNDFRQLTIDFNCLAKNCVSCTQFSAISSVFNHWSQFTGYFPFVPLLKPHRDKSDKNFQQLTVHITCLAKSRVFCINFSAISSIFNYWSQFTGYLQFSPLLEPHRDKK